MKKTILGFSMVLMACSFCFAQEVPSTETEVNVEIQESDFSVEKQIIGHWYFAKGSLFSNLEFYEDGTGKAYFKDSKNYSGFSWEINGTELIMKGAVKNKSEFSINDNQLIIKRLNTLKNATYEKVTD